jgi:hypothetical protein
MTHTLSILGTLALEILCFGRRFYCRSSKTRQLLLSAAHQNTGYSENVMFFSLIISDEINGTAL